jgi:hypothetical protein
MPAKLQYDRDVLRFECRHNSILHSRFANSEWAATKTTLAPGNHAWKRVTSLTMARRTYARALSVVRDEMKFLNAADKNWIMNKTIERV